MATRRRFLQAAIGGAAACCGGSLAAAAGALQRAALQATSLSDSLLLVSGAGANVLALRGPEGLVLVDGGLAQRSAEMLKLLQQQTGEKRIPVLINTHWHPENVGLNERLGPQGTKIIAHENTRLWLGTDIDVEWTEQSFHALSPKARPSQTIYTTATLAVGEEQLQYGYLPQAHTDGDLYVMFRKANVLMTGGPVISDGWPIVDRMTGGWIGGLVEGYRQLVSLADANTRVVSGDGKRLLTRADLEARRTMFATINDRLAKLLRSGRGPQEAVEAKPTKEWDEQFGDPTQFVVQSFRSLWGQMAPDA